MEYDYTYADPTAGLAFILPVVIIGLLIAVFLIICTWIIYSKAGKPGWASLIPIYNTIVLLEIVGKPLWWIILYIIPFVNIVFAIIVTVRLAKCFGKDIGFAIGLIILPFVFYPILAFGSAQYIGPDVE